jgi:glycerophosphoryl diester phosphodiesterase
MKSATVYAVDKGIAKCVRRMFWVMILTGVICALPGKSVTSDWSQRKLVAHALGGIKNHTYTNSLDALELNYSLGHRVFEVDLATTSDGVMVARHDWGEKLARHLEQDYDTSSTPLSLAAFKSRKINHVYTPLTLAELAGFMAQHRDMWLITDTKSTSPGEVMADFKLLVRTVKEVDKAVLARIVPQIYNQSMLPIVKECHDFRDIIYTLYQSNDTDQETVAFCLANKINVVTMVTARYTQTFAANLAQARINTYVHTVNELSEAQELLTRGARGLYTDFLKPSDVN